MADKRPQYKPTAALQDVLNALTPALNQNLKTNTNFTLLSFSKYEDDSGRMTFYVEGSGRRFRLEIDQSAKGSQQTSVKVLKAFEIMTK